MAQRKRTSELLHLRSLKDTTAHYDQDLLLRRATTGEAVAWLECLNECRAIHQAVNTNILRLQAQCRERLSRPIADRRAEQQMEAQVDALTQIVFARLVGDKAQQGTVPHALAQLEAAFIRSLSCPVATNAELNILRNVKSCVATETSAIYASVRHDLAQYRHALHKQKEKVQKLAEPERVLRKVISFDQKFDELLQDGFTQAQIDRILDDRQRALDEQNEVEHIVTQLEAIVDMSKDLNDMVIEQGTILDRVDHNVGLTLPRLHAAAVTLATTHPKPESYLKVKVCAMILSVVVFTAVVKKMASRS